MIESPRLKPDLNVTMIKYSQDVINRSKNLNGFQYLIIFRSEKESGVKTRSNITRRS